MSSSYCKDQCKKILERAGLEREDIMKPHNHEIKCIQKRIIILLMRWGLNRHQVSRWTGLPTFYIQEIYDRSKRILNA